MKPFKLKERKMVEYAEKFPETKAEMEALLRDGVDINACDTDEDDRERTLLSECIRMCSGAQMPALVQFFLENGHDLTRNGGIFGAAALLALAEAEADAAVLDAAKLLLRAGADASVKLNGEDLLRSIGLRGNLAYYMENDLAKVSLYTVLREIIEAASAGEDYENCFTIDAVIGKRVDGIVSDAPYGELLALEQNGKQIKAGEVILRCGEQYLCIDAVAGACVLPKEPERAEHHIRPLDLFGYPKEKPLVIEAIYHAPIDENRSGLYLKPKDDEVILITQL